VKKSDVIQMILQDKLVNLSPREKGLAFAPTNIALCKYWGKREAELKLPMTSSLSISLPDKGALTSIAIREGKDLIILNGNELAADTPFVTRVVSYLDLFRLSKKWYLQIDIKMNIPVAAGLASSACGFASLAAALNDLYDWKLSQRNLSILARLGSGSAARSLWKGFVEWHAGVRPDGMDSYAEPLNFEWPELRIGILSLSTAEKSISSRTAMQHTVDTSVLYNSWPKKVARDMVILRQALQRKNFALLAGTSESNAMTMHATMLSSWPPVCYFLPETIAAMQRIWALRKEGLNVFFTEDAGPNLKLLFLNKDEEAVKLHFPDLEVIRLFD
jgi:diphosphomevalonate decarboxylase